MLVPYAVAWPDVDGDFHKHWQENHQWLAYQDEYTHSGSDADWLAFKDAIQQKREEIFSTMRKLRYPVDVVDLRILNNKPPTNHEGYILAAQWIVDHCDKLIAVLANDRECVATEEWTDGGTGHTVAQWEKHNGGQVVRLDPEIDPV